MHRGRGGHRAPGSEATERVSRPSAQVGKQGDDSYSGRSHGPDENGLSNHAETLWTKQVALPGRQFFLDLRKNERGVYLKLTELCPQKFKKVLLLPGMVAKLVLDALKAAISGEHAPPSNTCAEELEGRGVVLLSRTIKAARKTFFLDVMENSRGRILKVSEVSDSGKAVVILPEASWLQVCRSMEEMRAGFPDFMEDTDQIVLEPAKVALQPPSATARPTNDLPKSKPGSWKFPFRGEQTPLQENVSRVVSGDGAGEQQQSDIAANPLHKVSLASKIMCQPTRKFHLDLFQNDNGRYLKLVQVSSKDNVTTRDVVFLPSELWRLLSELLSLIAQDALDRSVEGLVPQAMPTVVQGGYSSRSTPVDARSFKSIAGKLFFIDLMQNPGSRFLRIKEVKASAHPLKGPSARSSVVLPESCLQGFKQALDEFALIP